LRADYANALAGLGRRLSDLGQPRDGLARTSQAVTIFRELAKTDSAFADQKYAAALDDFANVRISAQVSLAEAFAAAQRSVTMYSRLAELNPHRYRDELQVAIRTTADALSGLGLTSDASQVRLLADTDTREAARLIQRITHPDLTDN
jgi:hypothetical protein